MLTGSDKWSYYGGVEEGGNGVHVGVKFDLPRPQGRAIWVDLEPGFPLKVYWFFFVFCFLIPNSVMYTEGDFYRWLYLLPQLSDWTESDFWVDD